MKTAQKQSCPIRGISLFRRPAGGWAWAVFETSEAHMCHLMEFGREASRYLALRAAGRVAGGQAVEVSLVYALAIDAAHFDDEVDS
jgi:hypothetical protein